MLAPQIVDAEQNMEIQDQSSTNIRTDLNKANSDWKYNPVKGINLVHYRVRIDVPQTLHKRDLKWYNCYLQHPGGDRIDQILTTVCRQSGIVDQA